MRDVKIWLALHALSLASFFLLAAASFVSFAVWLKVDHQQSILNIMITSFGTIFAVQQAALYNKFHSLQKTIEESNNGPSQANISRKRHLLAASIVVRAVGIGACVYLASYSGWLMYRRLPTLFLLACTVIILATVTLAADVQQTVKTQRMHREIASLGQALFVSDDDEAEGQIFIE